MFKELKCANNKEAKIKILLAMGLCILFMITEFTGGYFAGSVAIMSDAAHLLSDCISFFISILAVCMSSKPADYKMSFGYKRIEVIGALASVLGIWLLTALLFYIAFERIITNDFNIDVDTMMITASISILMNIIMGLILHGSCGFLGSHMHSHSHLHNVSHEGKIEEQLLGSQVPTFIISNAQKPKIKKDIANGDITKLPSSIPNNDNAHQSNFKENPPVEVIKSSGELDYTKNERKEQNLNIRAASIHVLGDFIQSVGVFIASVIIKFKPEAKIADPLCTLLFSIIVMVTTYKIIRESFLVVLNAVPDGISVRQVEGDLKSIQGVKEVHFINIWSHSVNYNVITGHLVIDEFADSALVLQRALEISRYKYKFKYATFQIESILHFYPN